MNRTFLNPLLVSTTAINKSYPNASSSSAAAIRVQMNVTVLLSGGDQSNIADTYSYLLQGMLTYVCMYVLVLCTECM